VRWDIRPEQPGDAGAIRRVHEVAFEGPADVLALGPVGVLPELQRGGAGSALIREALHRAAATDFPLVVLLGHPAYYPRFGFEPAAELGLDAPWDVPPEAWLALRLPAYRDDIRGTMVYPAPWGAVT
jgi:putative acetyltransferase